MFVVVVVYLANPLSLTVYADASYHFSAQSQTWPSPQSWPAARRRTTKLRVLDFDKGGYIN